MVISKVVTFLVGVNVMGLIALLFFALMPDVLGQGVVRPNRFTVAVGATPETKDLEIIYITDVATHRMVAVRYSQNSKGFEIVGLRNLNNDLQRLSRMR